jgi:hypothetical protein
LTVSPVFRRKNSKRQPGAPAASADTPESTGANEAQAEDANMVWAVAKGTGPATALDGGMANTGVIGQLYQHRHEHAAPRTPAPWPHQVGVIPSRAQRLQDRAETDRLAQVLARGGTAVVKSADRAPDSEVKTLPGLDRQGAEGVVVTW